MTFLHQLRQRLDALGLRQVWRVIVFVVGATIILIGVAMIVLPGPATLVIPAGLAVLGLEFEWARRWLRRARAVVRKGMRSTSRRPSNAQPPIIPAELAPDNAHAGGSGPANAQPPIIPSAPSRN